VSQLIIDSYHLHPPLTEHYGATVLLCVTSAIHTKPGGESRVPTDLWSGRGFSRSMPDADLRLRLNHGAFRGYRHHVDSIPFEVHVRCLSDAVGCSHGNLCHFSVDTPVCRGCDQLQCIQFSWNKISYRVIYYHYSLSLVWHLLDTVFDYKTRSLDSRVFHLIASSYCPTQCISTLEVHHVDVGRYERDNYFECVQTPVDCHLFSSYRKMWLESTL